MLDSETKKKRKLTVVFVVLLSFAIKIFVSFHPHSGEGKPPMYGDFEAQRHWMEITNNLAINEWYVHSKKNDLLYWGLDYPPLTAYHMYLCGKIGKLVLPEMVVLRKSRGIETPEVKFFLRSTVLISDILFYTPALIMFVFEFYKNREHSKKVLILAFILCQPALTIIDFGHFQYNGVALGLCVYAIVAILKNRIYIASSLFTLSLSYKIMSSYYALPFFFYLLGVSFKGKKFTQGVANTLKIGVVVLSTLVVLFAPFYSSISNVVQRMFPFDRGMFEDKVANFWCSITLFIKFRKIFSKETLVRLSLIATLLSSLPSGVHLLLRPSKKSFLYSLVITSLGFFFFSFHVHEKTILFPLTIVILVVDVTPRIKPIVNMFVLVSMYSMYPLFVKDGLILAYWCLMLISIFYFFLDWKLIGTAMKWMYGCILVGMGVAHFLVDFVSPPERYPHLFVYFITESSFGLFMAFWVYIHFLQFSKETKIKI